MTSFTKKKKKDAIVLIKIKKIVNLLLLVQLLITSLHIAEIFEHFRKQDNIPFILFNTEFLTSLVLSIIYLTICRPFLSLASIPHPLNVYKFATKISNMLPFLCESQCLLFCKIICINTILVIQYSKKI